MLASTKAHSAAASGTSPMCRTYTASKAPVNAFIEWLALELEPFGLRARLALPGRAPGSALGVNARTRMGLDIPEACADKAARIFAQFGNPAAAVTRAADVAEAMWHAVNDPSCPMRVPAGADAITWAEAARD